MRARVQALVFRGTQALFAYGNVGGGVYRHSFVGGRLEDNETPEEGVLRELREEATVVGHLLFFIPDPLDPHHLTFLVDIGDQVPELGSNPEEGEVPDEEKHLQRLIWLDLSDHKAFTGIDRAFFRNLLLECRRRGHQATWLPALEILLATD